MCNGGNMKIEDLFREAKSLQLETAEEVPLDELSRLTIPCYTTTPGGAVIGLNLSNIELTELPEIVTRISTLRVLRLFGNNLSALPSSMDRLLDLEALYLGANHFTDESLFSEGSLEVICKLPSLTTLALNHNGLFEVPKMTFRCPRLQTLKLGSNHISALPPELLQLSNLRGLFLDTNAITTLPPWLSGMRALEELILANNPVESLPPAINQLTRLKLLSLRQTRVTQLDPEVFSLAGLKVLNLRGAPLAVLPPQVGNLVNLTGIDLSGTQITSLPSQFGQLLRLQLLGLSGLRFPEIPASIFGLTALRNLNLSGTRAQTIPAAISNLTDLRSLDLGAMGLLSVPAELFLLPALRRLNLSGNRLRSIPPAIAVSTLEIYWKEPRSTEEGIFLSGNPLQSPPFEVISAGTNAVHTYFASLGKDHRPIDEVKVLLVGEGGAGKTSLAKRLTAQDFDPHESQTHGINIRDFPLQAGGKQIRVHFWDFGGQEILHATHQFFLSKRSAYLLVLDGRREEKTEYWLKHIRSFGGDSPILIVLNKADENPTFDINRRFLSEKYDTIRGFHKVSCLSGDGVDGVVKALGATLARVESTKTVWPASWFNVKEALQQMTTDYISLKVFTSLCRSKQLVDAASQNTLLEFLHDLGVVLHFRDLPLQDTNVINPQWVTNGVYKIINCRSVSETGGTLKLDLLPDILNEASHPTDKHNFIVELMKKFELCYSVDDRTLLLPALLPVEEPSLRFPTADISAFRIEYDFLPKSVMPRFIVRMHGDIEGGARWRTGVVLKSEVLETRALVRADELERSIDIAVSGPQRRDYLGVIVHAFRSINESFERLDFVEKVPLPDKPRVAVSYAHLLRLERLGVQLYLPDGAEHEYQVSELLGSIQPRRKTEDEILAILRRLAERDDTEESLLRKANSSVMLQPNLFGIGLNLNELIRRVLKRSRR